MSVYKHAQGRLWHYDFVYKGRRFHGSTGQETRRAAEAVERRTRLEAAEGRLDDDGGLTLDQACGKWWLEHGRTLRDPDVERRLAKLIALIGPGVRLNAITTREVAAAIERRRGETFAKSDAAGAKRYRVSAATVNKAVIGMLRPILHRAARVWGAKGLHPIDWRAVRLAEPAERVVYYTAAQQAAWLGQCDPTARLALQLLLAYGLRFGELFFAPGCYDPDGPRLVLANRKAGDAHVVPLRQADARQVAIRAGRAAAAGLESTWFEADAKGKPVAVSYYGMQARLRSAARRAGITARAPIHGSRHHAGTAMLRATGNLKLTQALLGHADIKSTARYAHALEADLHRALGDDEESRNSPDALAEAAAFTVPKQRRTKA